MVARRSFSAGASRCCLLALLLLGWASPVAGQVSPVRLEASAEAGRRSLAGLAGVRIQADLTTDAEAALAGVKPGPVLAFVESVLEDAGVPVLTDEFPSGTTRPATLQLELGVTTLRAGAATLGWAYFLNLQLLQEVCIPGLPHASGCAPVPTWGTRSAQPTVVPGDLEKMVYAQLAEALGRFVRDYLGANPTSTGREDLATGP